MIITINSATEKAEILSQIFRNNGPDLIIMFFDFVAVSIFDKNEKLKSETILR